MCIRDRLDSILDEVREHVYRYVRRHGRRLDEARLMLGEMYMGGDDVLWFVPGYLGIPVALLLISKFYELTGGRLTLSVGVVNANARYSVYDVMELAERLLKSAKKLYMSKYGLEDLAKGFIDFEFLTEGSPGGGGLESLRKTLERWGMTCKPYFVPRDDVMLPENALDRNFNQLLHVIPHFDYFWRSLKGEGDFRYDEEWVSGLKRAAKWMSRVLNMFKSVDPRERVREKGAALLYVMRESFRGGEGRDPALLEKIFILLNPKSGGKALEAPILLSDALDVVKMLGGGKV